MDKDENEKKKLFASRISANDDNDSEINVTSSIYKIKNNEKNNDNNNEDSSHKILIQKLFKTFDKNQINKDINKTEQLAKPNSHQNSIHNSKSERFEGKINNRYSNNESGDVSEKYDELSEKKEPDEKPCISTFKKVINIEKPDNMQKNVEEVNQSSELRKIIIRINNKNLSSYPQEKDIHILDKIDKGIKMKNQILENKEFIKKHYSSFEKDSKKCKLFIILFSVGIALSAISILFCSYLQLYGNQGSYILIGILSFILIVLYIFGIIFILKDKQNILQIIKKRDNPEKIFHSKHRKNFLLIIYLLIMAFIYHLISSLVNSAFLNNTKLSIRGKGYDVHQWIEMFAEKNYKEILLMFEKLNITFLVINWLNGILLLFIIIFKIILIINYRLIKSIIQVLCITAIQLGVFQIYLSVYCYRFRDVTSLEGMKLSWVTPGTMSNGFISIFLGIFGFYVFFIEHNRKILIFQIICCAQIILLCIFTGGLTSVEDKFYSYKHATCNSLFKFVSEEYLLKNKLSGCSSKYLYTSYTLNDIQCPKERIMINWEKTEKNYHEYNSEEWAELDEKESDKEVTNKVYYGCINQSCCLQIYFDIKNKFDFLLILNISQISYFILIFIVSIYIRIKLKTNLEEEISEKINLFILGILTLFVIFILLIFIFTVPNSSSQSILNDIKNNEVLDSLSIIQKDLTMVDNNFLFQYTNNSFASIKQKNINNFKYNIVFDYLNNNDYEYALSYYEYIITSSDLDIYIDEKNLMNIDYIEYKNYSYSNLMKKLEIRTKKNIINDILNYINLVPYQPLKNNILFNIEVFGIFVKNENNEAIDNRNDIINQEYNNIIITKEEIISNYNDDSKKSNISLIQKEIDFSIFDKNELFYIKGNIINDDGNSLISIYNYDYNIAPIYSVRTNTNGTFIIGPIYKFHSEKAIYFLNIIISKITINNNNEESGEEKYVQDTKYCKHYDLIKVSKLGFHSNQYYSLNNIKLPKNETGSMKVSFSI